jgi:hypothetical protein
MLVWLVKWERSRSAVDLVALLCTSLVQQRSQTPAGRSESRGTINQKRVSVASSCPSFSPRLRVLRCDVPFSSSPTRSGPCCAPGLGTPLLSLGSLGCDVDIQRAALGTIRDDLPLPWFLLRSKPRPAPRPLDTLQHSPPNSLLAEIERNRFSRRLSLIAQTRSDSIHLVLPSEKVKRTVV